MTRALPEGWEWARFDDVAVVASDLVDPRLTPEAPHVAPNHVSSWTGKLIERATISQDEVTSPKHRFRAGQIVYSKIRPYLAKAILADFDGLCSADMYPVDSEVDAKYLLHWILSAEFTEAACKSQGRTVLPKINQKALQQVPVPVPPLAEQRRIVEKIEALTARSGRAREALAALPALLDRYRAAVLAAAFRGDLTADWREEHRDAEEWQNRAEAIAQLRRQDWQGRRYVHGEPAEYVVDHAIPESWGRLSIDELSVLVQYGTSAKTSDAGEVPVLRMGNIQDGQLDFANLKYLPADHDEFPDLLLVAGDILFNRTNSAELVGKTAVYSGQASPCSFASYLIRVRVVGILPELVSAYINSPFGRAWVRDSVSQQVGQANLNGSKLKSLAIPVPPEGEQRAILAELRKAEDRLRCLWEAVAKGSDRLATLDSAILAKAFRGELVPQDPADEPASVLLERIRAGRAAAGESRGAGGGSRGRHEGGGHLPSLRATAPAAA